MNPWWVGVVVGGVLGAIGLVFAAARIAAEGGAEITLKGVTIKTGSTAVLAFLVGVGLLAFSLVKLTESPTKDPRTEKVAAEIEPILDESRKTLDEIGQVYGQMKATKNRDDITGAELETKLNRVILSRRQSKMDAQNLEVPPAALAARGELVEAFDLSLRYDLKLAECRTDGLDRGIGKIYSNCLREVDSLGTEATRAKTRFFRQAQRFLGRPLSDTSRF